MTNPRPNLLVAYLATPGGEDALALGAQLAQSFDADLKICLVVPPSTPAEQAVAPGDFQEILDRQAATWLDDALRTLPDGVDGEGYVAEYENAAEGLSIEAERLDSSMIVVGGSGGGILGRHTLGSVVTNLVHTSATPVAVTPRGIREIVTPVTRVTCAVGRRPGVEALLQAATRACTAADVPLRLLSLLPVDDGLSSDPTKDSEARRVVHEHLERTVAAVRDDLPDGHPVTTAIATGKTVEDAAASLDWEPGDLLYVGSSRLAQPFHLFLGSTAAKMLRVLAVPMIVVPRGA
mgnify:FL=1